jgi:hypothetical protein
MPLVLPSRYRVLKGDPTTITNRRAPSNQDEGDDEYEDDIVDWRYLLAYTGLNLAVKCLRNGGASTISKPRSSFFRPLISKMASTR